MINFEPIVKSFYISLHHPAVKGNMRTMVGNEQIVILDEVTSVLDNELVSFNKIKI